MKWLATLPYVRWLIGRPGGVPLRDTRIDPLAARSARRFPCVLRVGCRGQCACAQSGRQLPHRCRTVLPAVSAGGHERPVIEAFAAVGPRHPDHIRPAQWGVRLADEPMGLAGPRGDAIGGRHHRRRTSFRLCVLHFRHGPEFRQRRDLAARSPGAGRLCPGTAFDLQRPSGVASGGDVLLELFAPSRVRIPRSSADGRLAHQCGYHRVRQYGIRRADWRTVLRRRRLVVLVPPDAQSVRRGKLHWWRCSWRRRCRSSFSPGCS